MFDFLGLWYLNIGTGSYDYEYYAVGEREREFIAYDFTWKQQQLITYLQSRMRNQLR